MSLKVSSSESLLTQLRCTQCKKLLSVLPVYYCAAIGNVCGRCFSTLDWMISNGTLERAIAYESVAKHLIFPCMNKEYGCDVEIICDQVQEHEQSCKSTIVLCPFLTPLNTRKTQCAWKGSMVNLVTHLQAKHLHNIQTNLSSFEMNVNENNLQISLLPMYDRTFVIMTKYLKDVNKFYCLVMYCGKSPENECYGYQLQLGTCDNYFLILRRSCTEEFENTDENIEVHERIISVDIASINTMLNNIQSKIYFKVGIIKKNKKSVATIANEFKIPPEIVEKPPAAAIESATDNMPSTTKSLFPNFPMNHNNSSEQSVVHKDCNSQNQTSIKTAISLKGERAPEKSPTKDINTEKKLTKMDKQLLEELECPVCSEYMVPPIYICLTGHSLCQNCKDKVQDCPCCRQRIKNTRNFTLEKLTTRVQYECKYATAGCVGIFNNENIRCHESTCKYAKNKCPLKILPFQCNLRENVTDVIQHIREKHVEHFCEPNREYARNISTKVTSAYYVSIQENEVFIICSKHSTTTGPIKFNFLHVGMKNGKPQFRYEMEFIDQTKKGMKLIINQLCQVVPSNISAGLKNCLTIPIELLKPFILNKQKQSILYLKFRFERIC